jgi:hypothetical protein
VSRYYVLMLGCQVYAAGITEILLCIKIMKPTWCTFHSIYWEPRAFTCFERYLWHSQLTLYARIIPSAVCVAPPEDEPVMLETWRGPWFSINWMKSASRDAVAYQGGFGGSNLPPNFRSFDKVEPNSPFRGKYIRNNLIRIRFSPICKLSGTPD